MKVAFWGLALFVLSILGIVLVNLFGNITVTDQLNYTTMKNAVEASMYDSIDLAHYRAGFCLCTDVKKVNNKWVFKDDSEYEIKDITYVNGVETCNSKKTCEVLHGEYKINKKVFTESLVRRFAEMVNNNKNYEIIIQDIIEYPPKVSVRINSIDDEFLPTDDTYEGYTIVNQIDAILEVTGTTGKVTSTSTIVKPKTSSEGSNSSASTIGQPGSISGTVSSSTGTTSQTGGSSTSGSSTGTSSGTGTSSTTSSSINGFVTEPEACYYKGSPSWTYCWGTAASCGYGYQLEKSVTKKEKCTNTCFCEKNGDNCGVWADRPNDPEWSRYEYAPLVDGKCQRETTCYYNKRTYKYCWGTLGYCKGEDDDVYIWKDSNGRPPSQDECYNTCYCGTEDGNRDNCGIWAKWPWDKYEEVNLVDGECKREQSNTTSGGSSCSWYGKSSSAYCGKTYVSCVVTKGPYTSERGALNSGGELLKAAKAKCKCTVNGKDAKVDSIGTVNAYRMYDVKLSNGTIACSNIAAGSGSAAISLCAACKDKSCSAACK